MVDRQRLRGLLERATEATDACLTGAESDGTWVRSYYKGPESPEQKAAGLAEEELAEALRNAAPSLLDRLDALEEALASAVRMLNGEERTTGLGEIEDVLREG